MSYRDVQWRDDAACRGMDLDLFFPKKGARMIWGLQVCDRCTVTERCLTEELKREDPKLRAGVWGGMSPDDRVIEFGGRVAP